MGLIFGFSLTGWKSLRIISVQSEFRIQAPLNKEKNYWPLHNIAPDVSDISLPMI
jgi:hypothetical protein